MFSEKRKFAYKLETVHSVPMLYKKIFEEIKDADRIVLTQCPCYEVFYDCEAYRSLAKDKIFLRKAIEKKYENSNFNGLTFRLFLDYVVDSLLRNTEIRHDKKHKDDDSLKELAHIPWFKENEGGILKDIQNKITDMIAGHPDVEKEMALSFRRKEKSSKNLAYILIVSRLNSKVCMH